MPHDLHCNACQAFDLLTQCVKRVTQIFCLWLTLHCFRSSATFSSGLITVISLVSATCQKNWPEAIHAKQVWLGCVSASNCSKRALIFIVIKKSRSMHNAQSFNQNCNLCPNGHRLDAKARSEGYPEMRTVAEPLGLYFLISRDE